MLVRAAILGTSIGLSSGLLPALFANEQASRAKATLEGPAAIARAGEVDALLVRVEDESPKKSGTASDKSGGANKSKDAGPEINPAGGPHSKNTDSKRSSSSKWKGKGKGAAAKKLGGKLREKFKKRGSGGSSDRFKSDSQKPDHSQNNLKSNSAKKDSTKNRRSKPPADPSSTHST